MLGARGEDSALCGGGDAEVNVDGGELEGAGRLAHLGGCFGDDFEEDLAGDGACQRNKPVVGAGIFHVVVCDGFFDTGFDVLEIVVFTDGYPTVF